MHPILCRAVTGIVVLGAVLSAQPAPRHLNPVIEKLAAGKPVLGVNTTDLSVQNARALARADIDYVYVDMEHGPMDMTGLYNFTLGMIDKATILKKATRSRTSLCSRGSRLRWASRAYGWRGRRWTSD